MRSARHAVTRSRTRRRRPVWLVAALLASGCGYSLGYRMPPGIRTVAVPVFQNATFPLRREVEFELTSAVRQEIQARTSLRIVDESSGPDMVVRGRILEFRERVVAEGRLARKTESNVVALVELSIENLREDTRRVRRVTDVEPFSIEAGESFAAGQRRAIRNLSEKLVVALEDWGGEEEPDPPAAEKPADAAAPGAG